MSRFRTTRRRDPHGVPGQVNIYVLDVDSEITGYGAHNPLLVFLDGTSIDIREDLRGLPLSTDKQRRAVANGRRRMHPRRTRLEFVSSSEPYGPPDRQSIEHVYRITTNR